MKEMALLPPKIDKSEKINEWQQFKLLMWREIVGIRRDPKKFTIMTFQCVFQALLSLALFFGQSELSQARSLIGGLFHIVVDHVMRNMMGTIIIF